MEHQEHVENADHVPVPSGVTITGLGAMLTTNTQHGALWMLSQQSIRHCMQEEEEELQTRVRQLNARVCHAPGHCCTCRSGVARSWASALPMNKSCLALLTANALVEGLCGQALGLCSSHQQTPPGPRSQRTRTKRNSELVWPGPGALRGPTASHFHSPSASHQVDAHSKHAGGGGAVQQGCC
eukprot:scaffold53341_cov21-Tisochrysis_lutea.AAC.1